TVEQCTRHTMPFRPCKRLLVRGRRFCRNQRKNFPKPQPRIEPAQRGRFAQGAVELRILHKIEPIHNPLCKSTGSENLDFAVHGSGVRRKAGHHGLHVRHLHLLTVEQNLGRGRVKRGLLKHDDHHQRGQSKRYAEDKTEPLAKRAVERREIKLQKAVDRKSTRLNSSHVKISYAVFCLKKKKIKERKTAKTQ